MSIKDLNQFEVKVKNALEEFVSLIEDINPGPREVPIDKSKTETVLVNDKKLKGAFKAILKDKSSFLDTSKKLQKHFEELRPIISLCSSPKAFRTGWSLRSSKLSDLDAEEIINDGGQLIPINSQTRFLRTEQQGALYSPQNFLQAVRHVEGNYDDELDDYGRFIYQPPRDVSGMMRYRWGQILSKHLNVPYVVICIMWFEYIIDKNIKHVFLLSPAKIIEYEKDLSDLNASFHKPLSLELLQRNDAYISLNQFKALNDDVVDIKIRSMLDEKLAREWSYDKINTGSKGNQIKKWAKKNSLKCPGEICGGIQFIDLRNQDIAFGHIISRNWTSAFNFMLDKVHHPDNLYLTCKKCNSSLSDNFPDKSLKKNIAKYGTIGDWLRTNEDKIREQK